MCHHKVCVTTMSVSPHKTYHNIKCVTTHTVSPHRMCHHMNTSLQKWIVPSRGFGAFSLYLLYDGAHHILWCWILKNKSIKIKINLWGLKFIIKMQRVCEPAVVIAGSWLMLIFVVALYKCRYKVIYIHTNVSPALYRQNPAQNAGLGLGPNNA